MVRCVGAWPGTAVGVREVVARHGVGDPDSDETFDRFRAMSTDSTHVVTVNAVAIAELSAASGTTCDARQRR